MTVMVSLELHLAADCDTDKGEHAARLALMEALETLGLLQDSRVLRASFVCTPLKPPRPAFEPPSAAPAKVAQNGARRYPVKPLLDLLGEPTLKERAERLDVAPASIRRWHHRGLPWRAAEKAASRLDLRPTEIWPDWCSEAA